MSESEKITIESPQNIYLESYTDIAEKIEQSSVTKFTTLNEQFVQIADQVPKNLIDQNTILDIYNGLGDAEMQRKRIRQSQKKGSKPKLKNKKEAKTLKTSIKTQQLLLQKLQPQNRKIIMTLVQLYQKQIRPLYTHDSIHVFRFDRKRNLFKYCLYSLFELHQLNQSQLTQIQKQLIKNHLKNPSQYLKQLIKQIDQIFIKICNQNNRSKMLRQFIFQWDILNRQMIQQDNLQLRRKVITKVYKPTDLATLPQMSFYSKNKRQQLLEKKKKYLEEFVAEQKKFHYQQEIQPVYSQMWGDLSYSSKTSVDKQFNNIHNELKMIMLQGPIRMAQRIKRQLVGDIKDRLIDNHRNIYGKDKVNAQ